MKALLWKDYRINRAILITGFSTLAGTYLACWLVHVADGSAAGMSRSEWGETLTSAVLAGMAVSLMSISLLGANAFTSERTDRSAEFLACLPPSRLAVLTSKFVLVLTAFVPIWGVNLGVVYVVIPWLGGTEPSVGELTGFLLSTCILCFSAGWAASTVMSSPVGAWGIGTAAPMAVGGVLLSSSHYFGTPGREELGSWYSTSAVVVGVVAFIVSSVIYVRRVTP